MVLECTPEEASLVQDRLFSAAASVYIPVKRNMAGRLRTTRHFAAPVHWTRKQETLYETCACVIHTNLQLPLYETLHDLPFSVHLKRASETQNHLTAWVPEHQGTGYFMRSETCACVIHINLHTLSAACASYSNVCAGYMCFVKL